MPVQVDSCPVQVYNALGQLSTVILKFERRTNHEGVSFGYMMAYERLEPIPSHLYDESVRTHQIVLGVKSVSSAHAYHLVSDPRTSVAISFTVAQGHKHLDVGVGKHYYWAESKIWSQAPYGNISRLVRFNGDPRAMLHVTLDPVLSAPNNLAALETAIATVVGRHIK